MSSWLIRWKLSWLRLGGAALARDPRMTMRLEISGGSRCRHGGLAWVGDEGPNAHPHPVQGPPYRTSGPWQATAAQGEAVGAGPQAATLQGGSQLPHAGEGAVPALQREDPGLQLNGEFAQVHVLCARGLRWGPGGRAVSRGPGQKRTQPRPRTPGPGSPALSAPP